MKRNLPILLGLALGLPALTGCVAPAPAPVAAAPCPAVIAPPPVAAVIPPPTPVWTPPRRHIAVAVHPVHHVVVHRHWTHRYVSRVVYREAWAPGCGSTVHPCNVEHLSVPIK